MKQHTRLPTSTILLCRAEVHRHRCCRMAVKISFFSPSDHAVQSLLPRCFTASAYGATSTSPPYSCFNAATVTALQYELSSAGNPSTARALGVRPPRN